MVSKSPVKLLDQVRHCMRLKQYSARTEEAYVSWIKKYILFHNKKHPKDMGHKDIEAFITFLAVKQGVAASTQNQALNALIFLYKHVLVVDVPGVVYAKRAKLPERIPVVLSEQEIFSLVESMTGPTQLIAKLLYGTGMRGIECLRLRVDSIDFQRNEITVNQGDDRNNRIRITILPHSLRKPLIEQLRFVKRLYRKDLGNSRGMTHLQSKHDRLSRDQKEFERQYIFPSNKLSIDPGTGIKKRDHFQLSSLNKAIRKAAEIACVDKQVSSYVLRHSFAVHSLEDGYDMRKVQELLGHRYIENTMIYNHFISVKSPAIRSPVDKVLFENC